MSTSNPNTSSIPLLYQPLNNRREIRLIKFLSGKTPTCQMLTVEVEKAPPYVALSYTWGFRYLERKLNVNGHEIAISKNLAEAIDATFVLAREANLMFWADSICINQADVHERSRQVQLMGTIYRSAELVYVWLGLAENDSDFAFDEIMKWKSRFDELKLQNGGSDELAVTNIASDDPYFFNVRAPRVQKALRMICRRSWWRRTWVVQEGTMISPFRTLLCCGNRMINWECLRAALQITHHVIHFVREGMSVDFEDGMAIRLDAFRKDRETGAMIRLLRVLELLRGYECEDPRDKIYAALGMAMDIKEDDIIPNYTKSCPEVYCDLAHFALASSNDHSLDFLGHVLRSDTGSCFEHEADSALPSWAPDWRIQASFFPFEKRLDMDEFVSEKVYNASGSIFGRPKIENSQLFLQGSVLDRISRVWPVCEWNLASGGLNCERSWMPTIPSSKYATGGTLIEAFNHTLLADLGRTNYVRNGEFVRGCAVDWELLARDKTKMTGFERQRQSWMLIDIKTTTFGRRLFETSRGFIGLGPAACRPNDNVCVIFGGQVLYLLREHSIANYEFIGECYTHGMMDGQALEDESFCNREFIVL